ncbi:MAG: anaerobic sulfite reductase subunit AsrA [Halanaerobiales bacterium]
MSFKLGYEKMDQILAELKNDFKVFAPVRLEGQGRYSDTDVIRYEEIDSMSEIVYDEKSDFSPKEVIHPITQTLFYFTEHQFRESEIYDKELLILARPCDINGFERLDKIFLENGDFEDKYYKRMRDRVNFALMECKEGGWDSCFCVSMGSNETDNYSLAFRFEDSNLAVEVKDNKFAGFFADEESAEFSPRFVTENKIDVNIPEIDSEEMLQKVYDLDMWEEYNDRCESCGACTASCVTCSCFTTRDVIYTENGKAGERRRNWASCLHEDFTEMAGGHSFRETPAERMRFRTLHKVYDYKERFGENHMCVGCGRCTDSCNELISFSSTINKLSEAVQEIKV